MSEQAILQLIFLVIGMGIGASVTVYLYEERSKRHE